MGLLSLLVEEVSLRTGETMEMRKRTVLPPMREIILVVLTAAIAILFAIAIDTIEELPQEPGAEGVEILWKN